MSRNRRGPGIIRTAARTAVISGTATATSRAVANRMDQKAAMRSQQAQPAQATPQVEYVPVPVPAAPEPSPAQPSDLVAQLAQLAQLRDAGALSEEEFQQAKSRLLA
jgi:hypothetical protein